METKHTKTNSTGAWCAVEYCGMINIQDGPYYEDTNLLSMEDCEEAIANAKLMASAPLLLEALQELIVLAESGYQSNVKNKHFEEHLQEDRTLLMKAREAIKLALE